jgi:hypothetical protein
VPDRVFGHIPGYPEGSRFGPHAYSVAQSRCPNRRGPTRGRSRQRRPLVPSRVLEEGFVLRCSHRALVGGIMLTAERVVAR